MGLIKIIEVISHEGILTFFLKATLWPINKYWLRQMGMKRWEKAARIGMGIVKFFPKRIEYSQRLAICYKNLGEEQLATNTLKATLDLNIKLTELIKETEKSIPNQNFISRTYHYLGGEQNLGCVKHVVLDKRGIHQLLTKISTKSGFEKEHEFYLYVYQAFPILEEITPKVLHIKEVERDITLLTMEMIDGVEPKLTRKDLIGVIKANNVITSIKYKDLKEIIRAVDFDTKFELIYKNDINHPIKALHSFSAIHKECTNKQLFHLVIERMNKLNYSRNTFELLERLEHVLFDHQLFSKLNPEVHYSLQHGDFNTHNMLMNEETGKLYIIDWGNMRIGPTWVDIAGFLGQLKMPFRMIREEFLECFEASKNLEPIEKMFFIYTLIITWFIVFARDEFEELTSLYTLPAIEMLETMVKEEYGVNSYVNHGIIS